MALVENSTAFRGGAGGVLAKFPAQCVRFAKQLLDADLQIFGAVSSLHGIGLVPTALRAFAWVVMNRTEPHAAIVIAICTTRLRDLRPRAFGPRRRTRSP